MVGSALVTIVDDRIATNMPMYRPDSACRICRCDIPAPARGVVSTAVMQPPDPVARGNHRSSWLPQATDKSVASAAAHRHCGSHDALTSPPRPPEKPEHSE